MLESAGKIIDLALDMATVAASPSCWVLKECGAPAAPRHQRPRWLVITGSEQERCYRDTCSSCGESGIKVSGHSRSAHYRRIGEDAEGNPRHTWVRSCWVGPTETTIAGRRYRVELGERLS